MAHLKLCPKEDNCVINRKSGLCSYSVLEIVNEGIFCLEKYAKVLSIFISHPEQRKETIQSTLVVFRSMKNDEFCHRRAQETSAAFSDNRH